jgi:carboxylesterase
MIREVSAPAEPLLLKDSYRMITLDKERYIPLWRSTAFFDCVAAAAGPQCVAA